MKGSLFACSGAMLVAGNAILSLVLWQILTVDPIVQGSTLPASELPATGNSPAPTFNRVARRSDPAAARLFGLPPAEVPKLARPLEAAQSEEAALRLVGVIMDEGADGEQIALVEYGMPAHIARLRTGARLDPSGWRVERISSSSVEMVRGDGRLTLKLD